MKLKSNAGTKEILIHEYTNADSSKGEYRKNQRPKNLTVKIPSPRGHSNYNSSSVYSPRVSSKLYGIQSAAQSNSPQYLTSTECKKLCFFGFDRIDALLQDIYSDLEKDGFK